MPQMSILFLAFTAATVIIYWLIPVNWRVSFLAIASSLFLATLDLISFAILATLTAIIYYSSHVENKDRNYPLIIAGLLLLFCGVRIAQLLQRADHLKHWLVFLGFGFYILKLIHYRIESQAGTFRPHNFLQFYTYMMFFPTITIGPINRFEDFQRSERRMRWDDVQLAKALERILYGYAKVVILANWLIGIQLLPLLGLINPDDRILALLLDSAGYGIMLYLTFAGFSDIAIGTSLLFGYQVGENFDHPFLKPNIGEFWQSWHMSLSSWCRQYVFLPIYTKSRNLAVAMLAAMMTLGLWHEFSLRFLLWGFYHGAGITMFRWYQRNLKPKLPVFQSTGMKLLARSAAVALTFVFVVVGFTIPRSSSLTQIFENFKLLLGG
jgi:D-alanyl-lipoteichoic acid acyltransferase DltB (MBOAT superfamily)